MYECHSPKCHCDCVSSCTIFLLFPYTQNPDDPTTFPGYQGDQRSPDIPSASQGPSSSHVASSGDTQTSLSHARGITVYPCPWPDLGHRSYHMSSGRIGLLLYVSLFSVSVVRISVTPEFVCSSHSDGIGKITGHDGYNRKIPTRRKPLPAGLVGCFVVLRCCH